METSFDRIKLVALLGFTAIATHIYGSVDHADSSLSTPLTTGRGSSATTTAAQVGVFSTPAPRRCLREHCLSLGESGLLEQQRTFNPNLQFSIPDGEEGERMKAGLAQYNIDKFAVIYDNSGSTYSLGDAGGGGGRFGGGSRFGGSTSSASTAGIGSTWSGGGGSGRSGGATSQSLSYSLVPDSTPTPAAPTPAADTTPKTKPIFLAQAEATSLLMKALPHTGTGSSEFYFLAFDSSPQLPIGINFPQVIDDPKQYNEYASNLDRIIPYSGGGTSLAPAVTLLMQELGKRAPGNMLLTIVTDGQTDDAPQTAAVLNDLASMFRAANKRLDLLVIGAGSIVSQTQAALTVAVSDEGRLMLGKTRASHFSHVTGGSYSYSGSQCNDAYLKSLTFFKSEDGRGRYCGAYRDYKDMAQTTLELLSGANDGSYELWIQASSGLFWAPKSHQWDIVKDYTANGSEGADYAYNKNEVIAMVRKDPAAGGVLSVTDEDGRSRCYLFEQKRNINVKRILDAGGIPTFTFEISSAVPEVQARIDWIKAH